MGETDLLEVGNYRISKDGTLSVVTGYEPKNGNAYIQTSIIANHAPLVKRIIRYDNGTDITESIEIAVRRAYKESIAHMTKDQLFAQNPNKAFDVGNIVYQGRGYNGLYRQFIQEQCGNLPIYTVYQHTGIRIIDGERVFLNGGNSVTKDGLTDRYKVELENQLQNYGFIKDKPVERYSVFKTLLYKLAEKRIMYPVVAYCFMTALTSLYREKGIEPAFVLYIIGKTGCRKTSLAKLILNFFGRFDYSTPSPAGFRDTLNSIEKKMSCADSVPLLIDDRIPTANAYLKQMIEQIEQGILRLIGDKNNRGRSNADGTLRKCYPPKSTAITTAEDAFQNVTESGIARAFSVPLKPDSINLDVLTFLQENTDSLNACMTDFIQWMLNKWDEQQEALYPAFVKLRKAAQGVGHGRLADAVAHLTLALSVMCDWLRSVGQMTEEEAHKVKQEGFEIFIAMATEQNKQVIEDKPTHLFLNALREMRETGNIRFINLTGQATNNIALHTGKDDIVGYYDDEYFYLIPDTSDSAIRQFYKKQDRNFPLSPRRIRECLADEGYLIKEGTQFTKLKRIFGQQKRYVWLYKKALDNEELEVN